MEHETLVKRLQDVLVMVKGNRNAEAKRELEIMLARLNPDDPWENDGAMFDNYFSPRDPS